MEKHKSNWVRYLSCCWLLALGLMTLFPVSLEAQNRKNVAAVVLDETGQPMIGVNVKVKGTDRKSVV